MLKNAKIVLGITGGIAAYKIPFLVRLLRQAGAEVRIVMTESATQFVTPMTLTTLAGHEVLVGTFPESGTHRIESETWHIDLGLWADLMVIAPATANTMAKLATGIADNAVTTLALALRCPLIISPAMDLDMWIHETTQRNVSLLLELGYFVIPPEEGELASGLKGPGRLPEMDTIVAEINRVLSRAHHDLEGKRILITAGPTHEPIDPVRFIGNRSSGKMGFALARAAAMRGAKVTLVSGPVQLTTPKNVRRVDVETAAEMLEAVQNEWATNDALIMSAAVADFTPEVTAKRKIKKEQLRGDYAVQLKPTGDILRAISSVKNGKPVVGFALETDNGLRNAKEKLKRKKLDIIVLNNALEKGAGFGTDTNVVTIVTRSGSVAKLKKMSKFDVAQEILDRLGKLLGRAQKAKQTGKKKSAGSESGSVPGSIIGTIR